jgi:hypothetical protein
MDSSGPCQRPRFPLKTIALGARNFFYFDDEDSWIRAACPTLFRYVTGIDDKVLAYLNQFYPFFRQKYSHTVEGSYFANTCTTCGSLQGDFHNHEDFGGAFFHDPFKPKPSHVKLITIDIPYDYQIDAQFGSMAYDPIFYPNKIQTTGNQNDKIKVIIF